MTKPAFTAELVAPCGMNCALCKAYLAYSRDAPRERGKVTHCQGCRVRNKMCAFVRRDCEKLRKNEIRFCYECSEMPCKRLAHLDEHYRLRYGMSMVENQMEIRDRGMDVFLQSQAERYKCPSCGDVVSVHDGKCYRCGYQGVKPAVKAGKAQWDRARWKPNVKGKL